MPCARPGGGRPIGVCGSVCVGDKVERERIIKRKNKKKEEK